MGIFSRAKLSLGLLLSVAVFIGIGGNSKIAEAVTAGCDPAKYKLMKGISELRTLYDVGATEEIIPKPDSVLQLSCFSKASQISAEKGGDIFSGNFTGNLNSVIKGVVDNISGNFSSGGLMAKYGISTSPAWDTNFATCNYMTDVWNAAQNDGINTAARFLDFDEILDAADSTTPLPPTSAILQQNLSTANVGTFISDIRSALAPAAPIPLMNVDANANGYLDLCDVMTNLNGGVPPAGC